MNLVMNSGSQLSRMLYQNYLVPVLSLAGCYHLMQVRWVDQTQYPMIVVASLSAVPQSCRTPLPNQYLDCMLLAVYTHTLWDLRCTSFTFKFQMISQNLEHLELIGILWPGRQVCGPKNSISMSFISCHIQSNVETPSPAGRPRAAATSTHNKIQPLHNFTYDLQKHECYV